MNTAVDEGTLEREVHGQADMGALAVISKAEIDVQIATAHRFPRSIKAFRDEALAMVTLTEEIADECIYALPRDGKTIEGPSARFAEVVASAWRNSRAGARVVDEAGEFVTAQGVFHDLERNVAITYEVKRRIVDKHGRRFKPDMIGVTANAACSIALRNAILKGVPKAFWSSIYEAARQTVMGDYQTLANRRAAALAAFQKFGVKPEQIFEKLGVKGEEDVSMEHLVVLRGLLTALKDGDTTIEESFAEKRPESTERGAAGLKAAVGAGAEPAVATEPKKAVEPSTAKPAEPAKAAAGAQPATDTSKASKKGTLELQEKYLQKFKGCKDAEFLSIVRDEVNLYEWTAEDLKVIDNAYKARRKELGDKS